MEKIMGVESSGKREAKRDRNPEKCPKKKKKESEVIKKMETLEAKNLLFEQK